MSYDPLDDALRRVANSVIDARINGARLLAESMALAFREHGTAAFSGTQIAEAIEHTFKDFELMELRRKK